MIDVGGRKSVFEQLLYVQRASRIMFEWAAESVLENVEKCSLFVVGVENFNDYTFRHAGRKKERKNGGVVEMGRMGAGY